MFLSREKSGSCHLKTYNITECLPDGVCTTSSSQRTQNRSTSTPAIVTVPKLNPDVIEISSDSDESEHDGHKKTERSVTKKQNLAFIKEEIELPDSESDDEVRPTKKMKMEETAPFTPMCIGTGPNPSSMPVTDTEKAFDAEKRTIAGTNLEIAIENAEKDRDGKFILTKKVKVDVIESLSEVPKRWPIPPIGSNVAYVIDLNNDKRWKEVEKKKGLDRFLKQEVFVSYLYV